MKHIFRYFKRFKKEMILAPCVKLLETVTDIVIPFLVSNMIDVGVKNHDLKYILIMGSVVVALNIVGIISALVCSRLAARASAGFAYEIRNGMYAHINTFSHAELDKFGTATLNNRITHDVSVIKGTLGSLLRVIMRAPLIVIGSSIMALIISWKLSLIFLIAAPLIFGVTVIILKKTTPLYDENQKALDKVGEITRENLQGARVIRAFNKQEDEEERFFDSTKKLKQTSNKVVAVSSLMTPLTGTIINFAIVAIMWFGALQVNINGLTQGQLVALVNYLTQIGSSLVTLGNMTISIIKSINCGKRIGEIFDTKPSVIETNTKPLDIIVDVSTPKVEFKNVSFSYSKNSKMAIKNLSFKAYSGQTIGIIGGTGSGKSSVVNLIPRFYDTTDGGVYVDGVNVKEYSFAELRDKMGIVPQKAVLFKGSLKENLRWRKRDASIEELKKAVKISQSEEFVRDLPQTYDFMVQAGGKNFSGGQRQRLTIARALVGDPEILIMDDSASALDFATDANLRKAIKENVKATVFLVSQRANTVKNADLIIVLENGDVVGMGKHDDLLKNCTVYREIYTSQTK